MEIFKFFLHFDEYLSQIINLFGPLTYIILFLIIFAETGLVITPFLPGDSLLFVIGTFAAQKYLNIIIVYICLLTAAILGDTANYWIGHHFRKRIFTNNKSRFINQAYLEKTREFYEKHGGKTIIIARFIPIIRTFAPFVAGVGQMHYRTFLTYNLIGGFVWVTSLTFAGYFFGNLPIIKNNFETAIFAIIFVSLIPVFYELIKHKMQKGKESTSKHKTSLEDIDKTFKKEHLND